MKHTLSTRHSKPREAFARQRWEFSIKSITFDDSTVMFSARMRTAAAQDRLQGPLPRHTVSRIAQTPFPFGNSEGVVVINTLGDNSTPEKNVVRAPSCVARATGRAIGSTDS